MKNYLDFTIYELVYSYMLKKKIKMTTGNLFWIMGKTMNRIEKINAKGKKVIYRRGIFEIDENWLTRFGLTARDSI